MEECEILENEEKMLQEVCREAKNEVKNQGSVFWEEIKLQGARFKGEFRKHIDCIDLFGRRAKKGEDADCDNGLKSIEKLKNGKIRG